MQKIKRSKTEKAAITSDSKTKKAMQYSLIETWILDHPTRIQMGIRKQVRITKNKEIPSRPIKKWSDDDFEINGKRSVVN